MAWARAGATLLSVLFLGGLLLVLAPVASAAPKLIVYEIQVSADPAIQGPELPVAIKANVGSGGACCYVVYGQKLQATISLPDNFTLVDDKGNEASQSLTSPGFETGTVAAQPGGGLTWIMAKWFIVTGPGYGKFQINVTVTGTNDAGDSLRETSSINVTIASGAAISSPILPHRPVVGRETPVLVNVSSRKGVSSVNLFLSPDNRTWTRYPMKNIQGDLYSCTIPAMSSEKTCHYYMESVDMANDSFRTGVYSLKLTDPQKIAGISGGAAVLVTAGSMAGMVLILYFGTRRVSAFRSKGLFLVGDAKMEAALRERDQMKSYQGRMVAMRWKLLAALAVITLVLFIISVLTGQLQSVIRHTTNPSEALIWPLS
jgi:hypothetical protein